MSDKNIVTETQESFYIYIERVARGAMNIAEKIREEQVGEAMNMIADFSEGVMWISQVIELMKNQNYKIDIDPTKLNEFLSEINEGLEREDYVIVADLFEYEIHPFFKQSQGERFIFEG
ncbi:hypothetical protein EDD68_1138 [Melghiribacillus thermohalophilus]|uniref:DUF8042 domain-containing protein n=1 Tax=Melghiribacillus thermohalophilus TaxID=1324956 RepID=A0A4R3MW45_9BACI|nr:hypothetical protein [Melghiribacillus thermohalophilus]TCT20445.1 hypothetical protein EDD68_1138 [Melghiribacillus thermohalophilus]